MENGQKSKIKIKKEIIIDSESKVLNEKALAEFLNNDTTHIEEPSDKEVAEEQSDEQAEEESSDDDNGEESSGVEDVGESSDDESEEDQLSDQGGEVQSGGQGGQETFDDESGQNQLGKNGEQDQSGKNGEQDQSGNNGGQNQSGNNGEQDQSGNNGGQDQSGNDSGQDQSGNNGGQNQSGNKDGQGQSGNSGEQNQSGNKDGQGQSGNSGGQNQSGRGAGGSRGSSPSNNGANAEPSTSTTSTPAPTSAPATTAPATTAPVTTAPATTAPVTIAPVTTAPAAAEGAAAATEAASGPPGWVLLAVSIILKILGWIKAHPYETIAIIVVCLAVALLPVVIPIMIIYAFIQGLWSWLSGAVGFAKDVMYQIADNVTWGIFDFDTNRDVDQYMKLLEMTDEDFEEGEDNKIQTRDMMFDMLDMTSDYYETFYATIHSEVIDGNTVKLPTNLQSSDAEAWINAPQTTKNKYLATTVFGLSEEIVSKFYYGDLYVKNGNRYEIAKNLIDGQKYYGITKYTHSGDTINKNDIDVKNGKYYIGEELVTQKYSVSEALVKNLYNGTLYKDYKDKKNREDLNPVEKIKGNEKNTYYYVSDDVVYTHLGDSINVENIVTYYDMLGAYSVDGIALNNLTDDGIFGTRGYNFKKVDFKKDNTPLYELTEEQREKKIKNFLEKRLYTYVAAENNFWESNGDEKLTLKDVVALPGTVSVGMSKNVVTAISGGISGLGNILDKAFFDNNNIKVDGYRVIEPTVLNASFAFNSEDGGESWKFYPLATTDSSTSLFVETSGTVISKLVENIPVLNEWIEKEESNVIYKEELFSFDFAQNYNDYDVYEKDGNFVSIDGENTYYTTGEYRHFNSGGWLKYKYTDIENKYVTVRCTSCSETKTDENGKAISHTHRELSRIKVEKEADATFNGKKIRVVNVKKTTFNEELSQTIASINDRISQGGYDKTGGTLNTGKSVTVGFKVKLNKKANEKIKEIIETSEGSDPKKEAQKIIYKLWKDGELAEKDKKVSKAQEEINALVGEGVVNLKDINSVNEFLKDLDIKLLDERELVKPYGIPSAFSYFVPLEESTRNIPFLLALAQEMADTRIALSPLQNDSSIMQKEEWNYKIDISNEITENPAKVDGWFAGNFDKDTGSLYIKAFGVTIVDIYPKILKTYELELKRTPIREVTEADLWDRKIKNEFVQIPSYEGNLEGDSYYVQKFDYILGNQYITYKDTPLNLIKDYNVSQADVGIYEEVTGRPFLSQYAYDKIMGEDTLKNEWKGALGIDKILLKPVQYTRIELIEDNRPEDKKAEGTLKSYGVKYLGDETSDVVAVQDGTVLKVIEVEQISDKDALYTNYVIIYHEDTKSFSMYATLDEIDVVKGQTVNAGEKIGECTKSMYFEYRLGGGDNKDFWAATPVSITDVLVDDLEQSKGEETPDGSYEG